MRYVSRWAGRRLRFQDCSSEPMDTNAAFIKKIKNMVLKMQGFVLSLLEGKALLL